MRMNDIDRIGADKADAKLDGLPVGFIGHRCQMDAATDVSQLRCERALRYTQACNMKEIARQALEQAQHVGFHSANDGATNNLQQINWTFGSGNDFHVSL